MQNKPMEEARFMAFKYFHNIQVKTGHVRRLTLEEARDEKRFPLGPQLSKDGEPFIWSYALDDRSE